MEDAALSERKLNHKTDLPVIGIDLMGGDGALELFYQAAEGIPAYFVLFGTQSAYQDFSSPHTFVEVSEVNAMDENPLLAIRQKRNSSMAKSLKWLAEKEIDAVISKGNTGALIGLSKLLLGMKSGMDRPALLALMPTKRDLMAVIDIGANLTASPDQLVQFAQEGIAFQRNRGIDLPKVGLLNVGTEEIKGGEELRRAYAQLQKELGSELFIGNIEGLEAFDGKVDVLVTDGFTGNVFLKTSEGLSDFFLERFRDHLPEEVAAELDHREYAGAIVSGVDGLVMKCHGNSDLLSLRRSIKRTLDQIQNRAMLAKN